MAKKEYTYEQICQEIRKKQYQPIYFLMGEEPYFIDQITRLLMDSVLDEEARDFNQMMFYGADTNVVDIINAARRYPMMSDYQLIIVREAQLIDKMELLSAYLKQPLSSTILVINYKYKTLDRRKALASAVEKNGILYEAKRIPPYKLLDYILSITKRGSIEIDRKAAIMLADFLGNDLHLLHRELNKLLTILTDQPRKLITPELVEKHVGISKEFNNFELVSAIVQKDALKANRIIQSFEKDAKNHPIQSTLPVLFNYFANLLICFYSQDKTERGIMTTLGFRYPIQAKEYLLGMRHFSAMKAYHAIHEIRLADAHSKGIDVTSSMTTGEILKELIYKLLH